MSAQLTVYTMAIEAERPLRFQEANQERLAAQAEAALGRRTDTLVHRFGELLRRSLRNRVPAIGWKRSGPGPSSVMEQPAG